MIHRKMLQMLSFSYLIPTIVYYINEEFTCWPAAEAKLPGLLYMSCLTR